ncbi:SIR2 family NAD-dependent protein deacylase [Viridibacterium curvum]|uniref:protein acetyllysine N-acetyltransferase n=1 Tax=Viridibacterium curvum TaxID=1101404 RepID=A0ABP9QFY2_9RHOO
MPAANDLSTAFSRAARLLEAADGLIIAAGAGMGVDSGLPDFRGPNGFWNAYPALGRARIPFEAIASPAYFESDPALAWGFYGHRLNLYRATVPHDGFAILRDIASHLEHGAFVFTSNVDGQFQKAGFNAQQIVEIHGSIHHLQCQRGCNARIWSAAHFKPEVDEDACHLRNAAPRCPDCGAIARPNILMFGDGDWLADRTQAQQWEFLAWRAQLRSPVVIELGAGTRVPTVRHFSEHQRCALIRINKTEWHVPAGMGVSVADGALSALQGIHARLTANNAPPRAE